MNEELSIPGTLPSKEDHGNFPSLFWGVSSILPAEPLTSDSQSFPPAQTSAGDTRVLLPGRRSKRLAEENQVFFPAGARQNLISGLVTSELGLSRLDTLWSALPMLSWIVDIPMASEKLPIWPKAKDDLTLNSPGLEPTAPAFILQPSLAF